MLPSESPRPRDSGDYAEPGDSFHSFDRENSGQAASSSGSLLTTLCSGVHGGGRWVARWPGLPGISGPVCSEWLFRSEETRRFSGSNVGSFHRFRWSVSDFPPCLKLRWRDAIACEISFAKTRHKNNLSGAFRRECVDRPLFDANFQLAPHGMGFWSISRKNVATKKHENFKKRTVFP